MEWLLGLLMSAFGAVVSNAIGTGAAATARKETFEYNEQSAENADKRTRSLYNDIGSPQQQITSTLQGLKENGLSPSVFYSGGSVSGSTQSGAQGGGAGNFMPNVFGINPMEGAQIKLAEAQAENLNADTELKNKETNRYDETKNAEIAQLLADAHKNESMTSYIECQEDLMKLTKASTIRQAAASAEKAEYEAKEAFNYLGISKTELKVAQETAEDRIKIQAKTVEQIIANTLKLESETKLNDAQVKEIATKISQMYDESMRGWAQIDINWQDQETFRRSIEQQAQQFRQSLELDAAKFGFTKDHYVWEKITDITGNLIHAGGYIIGLRAVGKGKGGKPYMTNKTLDPKGKWNKWGHLDSKGHYDYLHEMPVVPM